MFRTQQIYPTSMLSAVALTVAILGLVTVMTSPKVNSSASENVSGYAWSETIGWISFNSTNEAGPTGSYGVNVATNGALSGYAWSEHIGWISFNEASGCPSGTCAPSLNRTTGNVTGWARALSPASGVNTGGWDGWINLTGVSVGGGSGTACEWHGWAWGSDVVGWISFNSTDSGAGGGPYKVVGTGNGCNPATFACTGTAPSNATACSTVNPGGELPFGVVSSCLSGATKCHYRCNDGFIQSGNTCSATQCNDGSDNDSDGLSDFGNDLGCFDVNDNDEADGLPELTISPMTVLQGDDATFEWNLNGGIGCTLSGGNRTFDLTPPTVSSSSPIYARTTFTLTCPAGSDIVTVDIVPVGTET